MVWPLSLSRKPRPVRLREPVERHLGVSLADAQSVAHDIKPAERVNLQRALDRWAADPAAALLGYSSTGYLGDEGLVKYLITDELVRAPVERLEQESGPAGETLDCVVRGLYLLRRDGVPVVVGFRPPRYPGMPPVLEVLGPNRDAARDTLRALLAEAAADNVYKGRTLSVEAAGLAEGPTIRFQQLREASRDDIVLPDEVLRVVERNVMGMLKHGAALRAAGRSLRHGLLLHGPPGTGKSLVVRHLAHACTEHTVILMAGGQQGLVRESCQLAKMLAPSIVVLEDVDLIAADREENRCPVVLHELMNEMDGLGPRAEVIFLLTTNRPEILEPALSARPGRIDQAVAFPLPDDDCRRRLFGVYGRGLDLSGLDLPRWVGQTAGTSPAFIEELLRKAALLAAERGEPGPALRLTDDDVQGAVRELVVFGGELTQKLLGYRPARIGYQATG